MIDIDKWLEEYQKIVLNGFGARVLFIGIQGSYGRGEATEKSDIDVVLILDRVEFSDLKRYKAITAELPDRNLLCGFISGKAELKCWDKADLFQFFFDTKPIYGNLKELILIPSLADAKMAALTGACAIYHACSHNYLHASSPEVLSQLYKSSRFTLQASFFCQNGRYITHYSELRDHLEGKEKAVLETVIAGKIDNKNFDEASKLLLEWSRELIYRYNDRI